MTTVFEFGDGGFVATDQIAGADVLTDTAWNDERTNEYKIGTFTVAVYLKGGQTLTVVSGVTRPLAEKRVADVRAAMGGKTAASSSEPDKAAPVKKAAARTTAKKS